MARLRRMVLATYTGRRGRCARAWNAHEPPPARASPRRRVQEWCELRGLRSIPHWIGVSHWFLNEWKQVARVVPAAETVVYNPVDTRLFRPDPCIREPGLIVYAGGLKRRKGVDNLARAAGLVFQACETSRVVFLGFECDLSWNEVHALTGHSDRARFISFVPQHELAVWLRRAAVYAMPSRYESCGNGWLEASASGAPVVGSFASCGPEVVEDGRTGLLADPESPDDVAAKILTCLSDPGLAKSLGESGVAVARERFSLDRAILRTESF